ncbi:hypothetical protein P3S68_008181 [Capsicum galapagoense]
MTIKLLSFCLSIPLPIIILIVQFLKQEIQQYYPGLNVWNSDRNGKQVHYENT